MVKEHGTLMLGPFSHVEREGERVERGERGENPSWISLRTEEEEGERNLAVAVAGGGGPR